MSDFHIFEWDEAKAVSNLAKHKIEFAFATRVFLDAGRVDVDVSRIEDREIRRKVVGLVEGRLVTVVYTSRAASTRIISARRSNSGESKIYGPLRS
jgi:uncharacterized DUF497 family protein